MVVMILSQSLFSLWQRPHLVSSLECFKAYSLTVPSKVSIGSSSKDDPRLQKLRRTTKGLLNRYAWRMMVMFYYLLYACRLSEQNMESIITEIEGLYRSHSRHGKHFLLGYILVANSSVIYTDVTSTLTDIIIVVLLHHLLILLHPFRQQRAQQACEERLRLCVHQRDRRLPALLQYFSLFFEQRQQPIQLPLCQVYPHFRRNLPSPPSRRGRRRR